MDGIRAYLEYGGLRYRVHYWRNYEGVEVVALHGVCLCGRRARFEDIPIFPAAELLDAL